VLGLSEDVSPQPERRVAIVIIESVK